MSCRDTSFSIEKYETLKDIVAKIIFSEFEAIHQHHPLSSALSSSVPFQVFPKIT
jgi:hypothetical protein